MRALALALTLAAATPAAAVEATIGYLRVATDRPPTLSNLDPVPEDLGLAGARLGIADNATTGRFLGDAYALRPFEVAERADPVAALDAAMDEGLRLFVLDAPARDLPALAEAAAARGALLFNATADETALRDGGCHAALLHTTPSRAMRTDALAQFLLTKRWTEVAMIVGPSEDDAAFAAAMRASADKYGLEVIAEKGWDFDADMRRNAAQEVPLFTQDLAGADVIFVADEADDFARYIPFNTWEARPVVGSAGLRPEGWDRVVEQWGAAQLQSRFVDLAGRDMRSEDYAAWAAVRAVGEAVTRGRSPEAADVRAYLLSGAFELGGFKGRPLSFRPWNGQMRQPVALVHPRALVASAPLEGFLHEKNEMDGLGLDRRDSACTAFDKEKQ